MADKRIDQLTAATTMGDDDLLVLQQNNQAKKLSGATLSDYIYDVVEVSNTEPAESRNKVWIKPSTEDLVLAEQSDVDEIKAALDEKTELMQDYLVYNLAYNLEKTSKTTRGITFTWNGNTVTAVGTATDISNNDLFSSNNSFPPGFEAGKTYDILHSGTNIYTRVYAYVSGSSTQIFNSNASGYFNIPADATGLILRVYVKSGATVNESVTVDIMPRKLLTNKELTELFISVDNVNATVLTSGTDLDTLPIGNYIANTSAISQSLFNNPVTQTFRLFVMELQASNRFMQILFSPTQGIWIRTSGSNGYYSWYIVSKETGPGIVRRNSNLSEMFSSLKRHMHDLSGGSGARRLNHNNLFCIAHLSDIHLDTTRYGNFIDFCNFYSNYINARICTGDFVNDPADSQIAHMRDYESTKTVLWCDGNHERNGGTTGLTRQQVYEKWNLATWYQETGVTAPTGYTADTGREDYQMVFDYPLFYYKDYINSDSVSGYKIRLIVLNCCDYRTGISTSSTLPRYTTEQMKWFVDVLQDAATNDYAVIIAQHYMESSIESGENSSFFNRKNEDQSEVLDPDNGDVTVVENIIDAFRKGNTYTATNITVRPDDSANSKLSVNADFTNNQGQFLAWIVGHSHRDRIGYSKNHPDQLILEVVDGSLESTLDGITNNDMSNNSDLPRIIGERSEDAFNVYAFDPVNKLCKVMRVGSNLNDMMIPREYACFETEPSLT